jgi:hypothetical protein
MILLRIYKRYLYSTFEMAKICDGMTDHASHVKWKKVKNYILKEQLVSSIVQAAYSSFRCKALD